MRWRTSMDGWDTNPHALAQGFQARLASLVLQGPLALALSPRRLLLFQQLFTHIYSLLVELEVDVEGRGVLGEQQRTYHLDQHPRSPSVAGQQPRLRPLPRASGAPTALAAH